MVSISSCGKCPILTPLLDPSFGIPTDVTFDIMDYADTHLDNSGEIEFKLGEVKGHKLILGIFSPVFKKGLFGPAKDTKDSIPVRGTTLEAFEKMFEFIYNKETDWSALTVLELYDVVNLAEKYDLPGLMEKIQIQMGNVALTMENVMVVADTAYKFEQFPVISISLLHQCAKFIMTTLKTPTSLLEFAAGQSGSGQEAAVLKLMALIIPEIPIEPICPMCPIEPICPNCKSTPCQVLQLIQYNRNVAPGLAVLHLDTGLGYTVVTADPGNNTINVVTIVKPPLKLDHQPMSAFCYNCD